MATTTPTGHPSRPDDPPEGTRVGGFLLAMRYYECLVDYLPVIG